MYVACDLPGGLPGGLPPTGADVYIIQVTVSLWLYHIPIFLCGFLAPTVG